MGYVWLGIFFVMVIVVIISVNVYHKSLIEEKVARLNGTMISCTRRWGVVLVGPFDVIESNQSVFHFEYLVEDEIKEGWVKFSFWDKPDWRL